MSCGPHPADRAARRAENERMKQHQRQLWTAALTGAVTGAVSGARSTALDAQVRIGDAERERAVSALGEHYVAGRLTKDELDERADTAWAARTSGDLAPLFADLPALPTPAPPRPARRHPRRDARWLGARLSWVFVLLVVLAVAGDLPWLAVAVFAALWWTGLLSGLHRWAHHRR
jgi:hypothetical protein